MSLTQAADEYSQLSSSEQAQFAQATRRLLADGLIWREDEHDRPIYSFLRCGSVWAGRASSAAP